MCMCVLEMEEGKEGIKTPIWMSFSDMGCRLSEGSYTLTVDTREKQAEQQTLQPRHRSYRCRHCMCVRNCGISSKYKLISTPVYSPCKWSCKPQPHQSIYLRIESAIPGDRANTQLSPSFQPRACGTSRFIPKRGRRLACPTPLNKRAIRDPSHPVMFIKLTKCVQRRSSAAATQTL